MRVYTDEKREVFWMPNKRTKALTEEQYNEIIDTMKTGFTGCRPNNRIDGSGT